MNEGDSYTDVILEDIHSQITAVLQIVTATQSKIDKIDIIEQGVKELKSDIKVVKQAVKDTNKDLHLLDRRVTKLEKAA